MAVYVLRQRGTNLVKIGCTDHLSARLHKLRCANPAKLDLEHLWRGGAEMERMLHFWYEGSRVNREWFDLPPDTFIGLAFETISTKEANKPYATQECLVEPEFCQVQSILADDAVAVSGEQMVLEVVAMMRGRGYSINAAFQKAASVLGIRPRFVRSVYRREAFEFKATRLKHMRFGYIGWARAEAASLQADAQRLLMRVTDMEKAMAAGQGDLFGAAAPFAVQADKRKPAVVGEDFCA